MAETPNVETYVLHPRNDTQAVEENERLDDMHNGIQAYQDGALSLAPLGDSNPQKILELGSGSGAWAIEAAKQYPDAQVLAVDVIPLPSRPHGLPPNLTFQAHDLTQPFPWDPETFDIVHARFVILHLRAFEETLSRIVKLVKPGGWLLIEDVENVIYTEGGQSPGQRELWNTVHKNVRDRGADPLAPAAYEDILRGSGAFSEVTVHKVFTPLPRSGYGDRGGKLTIMGAAMLTSYRRGLQRFAENSLVTKELEEKAQAELTDPQYNQYVTMYFIWSQKQI